MLIDIAKFYGFIQEKGKITGVTPRKKEALEKFLKSNIEKQGDNGDLLLVDQTRLTRRLHNSKLYPPAIRQLLVKSQVRDIYLPNMELTRNKILAKPKKKTEKKAPSPSINKFVKKALGGRTELNETEKWICNALYINNNYSDELDAYTERRLLSLFLLVSGALEPGSKEEIDIQRLVVSKGYFEEHPPKLPDDIKEYKEFLWRLIQAFDVVRAPKQKFGDKKISKNPDASEAYTAMQHSLSKEGEELTGFELRAFLREKVFDALSKSSNEHAKMGNLSAIRNYIKLHKSKLPASDNSIEKIINYSYCLYRLNRLSFRAPAPLYLDIGCYEMKANLPFVLTKNFL